MKSTIIKGGLFFSPDRRFEKKDLLVAENRIEMIAEDIPVKDSSVINAENMYVVPGFIDLHTHGAYGSDVMLHGEKGLFALSRFFASKGVTGFLPTVMTSAVPEIKRALQSICNVMRNGIKGSKILGINMEGPFINESFKGAHDRESIIMPSIELFEDILEGAGGDLRMVTIAPELPCSREIISKYKDRIIFSAGHTAADSSTAEEAFNYGIHHITHLFNAMQSM
ncbi:MAG TPA: amidohydrolase family protein, partial [Clostridia bacterium]